MLISVVYQNDKHDMVKPFLLNELLASGKVKRFLRSDGWAIVGTSAIRGKDSAHKSYDVERRSNPSFLASP
jgi:hypothetical protein